MTTEIQRKDINMNTTLKDILDATLPVVEREIKVNVSGWETEFLLSLGLALYYKMQNGKSICIASEQCIEKSETSEGLVNRYIEAVKALLKPTQESNWPYWETYYELAYGRGQIVFGLDRI